MPIYGNVCLLVAINFRWCWWCCHHRLIHNIAKASKALNAHCAPVSLSLCMCLYACLMQTYIIHNPSPPHSLLYSISSHDGCVAYIHAKISFYGKWAVKQTHLNGIACINCSFGLGNHVCTVCMCVCVSHWICRQSTNRTYTNTHIGSDDVFFLVSFFLLLQFFFSLSLQTTTLVLAQSYCPAFNWIV